MLSSSQVGLLSPLNHKRFLLTLSNAYICQGNYQDAAKRLKEGISLNPQKQIKVMMENNLAIVSWWTRNPPQGLQFNQIQRQPQQPQQQHSTDFIQIRSRLLKAVAIAEGVQELNSTSGDLLAARAACYENQLDSKYQLQSVDSLKPAVNLSRYYLANDPIKKAQIFYWLKKSLKLAQKHNKPTQLDEVYIKLLFLSNDLGGLLNELPKAIARNQGKPQQAEYLKLMAVLDQMSGNESKSKESLSKVQTVSVPTNWQTISKHIAYQDYKV